MRESELGVLAGELLEDLGKGVELVLDGRLFALVEIDLVHLVHLAALQTVSNALSNNIGRVSNILTQKPRQKKKTAFFVFSLQEWRHEQQSQCANKGASAASKRCSCWAPAQHICQKTKETKHTKKNQTFRMRR